MELPIVDPPNPHFDRIGGAEAVRRLTGLFYDTMEALPEAARLRSLHLDLSDARVKLELFLTEWMGGEQVYSRAYGHPRLRMRHSRFPITPADRDMWMTCMRRALEQVVVDVSFRVELESAFAHVADALINTT